VPKGVIVFETIAIAICNLPLLSINSMLPSKNAPSVDRSMAANAFSNPSTFGIPSEMR